MKKRVLQFIGSFHQGGSERQAVSLTRLIKAEASYYVNLDSLNKEGVLLDEINSLELPEIEEYKLTSFYNPNFIRQVRRCAAYLRKNKIDLVHTHCFYANIFGMAAATLAGVPVRVASKRETGKMRTAAQDFVERLAFGRAHAIVVNAAAVRDYLIEHSIETEKIRIIYNGLDFSRFSNSDHDKVQTVESFSLPKAENIRFVTLVANLRHAVKNVPNLLRAARIVTAKFPDAHFVIAGEGELESDLKSMASELGLNGNVHFIGRCTDVPALLDISDICVLTSTAEGFANSILEYMAAGKAVIATNVGGAAEAIVDGETGYLIPSGDDPALAARLIELLENGQKAETFGTEGKRVVTERFSQNAQLTATLKLYDELLASVGN